MDSHQRRDIVTLVPLLEVWEYSLNRSVSILGSLGLVRAQTLSPHYRVGSCSALAQSAQKKFWQAIEQVYQVNRCMRLTVAGIPLSRCHWALPAKHCESLRLCGGVNHLAHGFLAPSALLKMKSQGIGPVIVFGASGI